jgi:uncharacterized protein (DUF2164 family)
MEKHDVEAYILYMLKRHILRSTDTARQIHRYGETDTTIRIQGHGIQQFLEIVIRRYGEYTYIN